MTCAAVGGANAHVRKGPQETGWDGCLQPLSEALGPGWSEEEPRAALCKLYNFCLSIKEQKIRWHLPIYYMYMYLFIRCAHSNVVIYYVFNENVQIQMLGNEILKCK